MKGVQSRTESSNSSYHEAVWTFRVERHDEAGNRVLLVPVEMRAQGFEGSLSEGDWVRVHGKMRSGTFHATKVENVTTGAVVAPKRTNYLLVAVFLVFFLGVLAFIAWIAITGFTQDSGAPDPPGDIGDVSETQCYDVPDDFPEEWQC